MSQLDYPEIRHSGGDWWPDSCTTQQWGGKHPFSQCPVCGASSTLHRNRLGQGSLYNREDTDKADVLFRKLGAYIAYGCGGIFTALPEKPGFWGGKCGYRQILKQKTLTLTD